MSSRRPLQPVPALSANIPSTRYGRSTTTTTTTTTTKTADGSLDMEAHMQDDVQNSDSAVSGLTSLSGDDDFERFMIEKAREERRRLAGREQAFRKARTHPRVGLTLDNLERNERNERNERDERDDAHSYSRPSAGAAHARIAVKSPPSSSGSTRSDPAIHAPAGWGRKGRTSRDWMRTITRDEPAQQTPAPPAEAPSRQRALGQRTHDDSPLSHKSFQQGPAPAKDSTGELDLTFDMNEASMLVSTPYMPRSTKLDDIREREMESLREQGLARARLERIREHSPEETRRPRSMAGRPTDADSAPPAEPAEPAPQDPGSPVRRLRRRTNSWQSLSKSQPALGTENSPIAVYTKSVETLGLVERDVVASADRQPARPFASRRSDSQDLLRRLARVSNTPSPKATAPAPPRPHTDPAPQPPSSSQAAAAAGPSHTPPHAKDETAKDTSVQSTATAPTASAATRQEQPRREQRHDTPHDGTTPDVPSSAPAPAPADVDATPMPTEQPVRDPKTPYVMGGWLDTPGPRTASKPADLPRPRSRSPKQGSTRTARPTETSTSPPDDEDTAVEQSPERTPRSIPRPQLPSSALHALVQDARAHHDYGEDTIHSLEELMGPIDDDEIDEDTLHGLSLPTSAPRSEAERERHAELRELHRLSEHLRLTSTGIRATSRDMRRLGTTVEHSQNGTAGERAPPVVLRHVCPEFSPWAWFRSFFWDERIKTQRQAEDGLLKIWGGVTLLGILLTVSFIYWASETIACEIYCHPQYATYSPYPFSVNIFAPRRGRVIPTLIYRALFKNWSTPIVSPIASLFSWMWSVLWSLGSGISMKALSRASYETAANVGSAGAAHTQASWIRQEDVQEEESWDWSMAEDEILRR